MAALFHRVDDLVYVRDEQFAWLPAIVLQVCDEEVGRVLVRIELPEDWSQTTTITSTAQEKFATLFNQERWVSLKEYYNHCLPMQNNRMCRDMAELDHLHEAEILYQIKHRHCVLEKPYTRVGDIIVAVNPCQWIPDLYSTEMQQFYMENFANAYLNAESGDFSEEKKDDDGVTLNAASSMLFGASDYDRLGCEPHIYEVSSLAYRGLTLDRKNQTILVSGESGSGKTESVKIVLKHLASLRLGQRPTDATTALTNDGTNSRGGDDDLILHLLASSPIFEAFGNAKTTRNSNSSRFGKVTQLHYTVTNTATTLSGVSFDTYLLETNRVVSHADKERNFQIFYQLLSASTEVKKELLGPDWGHTIPSDFLYLTTSTGSVMEEKHDTKKWSETLKALISFGWDGASLERLMRALGIVLLFGNVVFTESKENHARIGRPEDLIVLAFALGIPIEEMELALTKRTIQTAQDLLLVPFTSDQAKEACDALAKAIYNGIFSSIVRQINILTTPPPSFEGECETISLVDIFGFECFEVNRFEQFCVNFASERLQQKYILDTLKRHTLEYTAEGIALPDWKDVDNSDTVQLLEGHAGLIRTLNEQCIRPNGNSEAFIFIVKNANKKHASLIQDKLQSRTKFGVRHFAGDVIYEASDFIERNADKLPDFLIGVTATSTNELVAQELRNLLDESSRASNSSKKKANHRSVIDKFSRQLKDLLTSIDNSQTRYVRCIKPCEGTVRTKMMDHLTVVNQLKCAGLVTAIELSRETFPNKLPLLSVERRFACLLPREKRMYIKDVEPHDRAQLILTILFAPSIEKFRGSEFAMPFSCGYTKTYFRTGALETLEIDRQVLFAQTATRLQRWQRMCQKRSQYRRMSLGFTRLQAVIRSKPFGVELRRKIVAATRIQAATRSAICAARFLLLKDCVDDIEQWWVLVRTRRHYCRMQNAQKVLSSWNRMTQEKKRLRRIIAAISILQAFARTRVARTRFLELQKNSRAISSWWNIVAQRLRYLRMLNGITLFSALLRSRKRRAQYQHMRMAVVLIQARLRSRNTALHFARIKHAAQIVTRWCIGIRGRKKFERARLAATKIAGWSRSRSCRVHFCRIRVATVLLQARVRSRTMLRQYLATKQAAHHITRWSNTVLSQRKACRQRRASSTMTLWARSRVHRMKYIRKLQFAAVLNAWFRSRRERRRFTRLKFACNVVYHRRRNHLHKRKHAASIRIQRAARTSQLETRQQTKHQFTEANLRSKREFFAASKLTSFISAYLKSKMTDKELKSAKPGRCVTKLTSSDDPSSGVSNKPSAEKELPLTRRNDSKSVQPYDSDVTDKIQGGYSDGSGVLFSREMFEQIELLRKQVDDLSSDLMNVTSEAELHKQEVEAEFEERLAEYEEEVLLLKQTMVGHEEEKETLKAEIAANVQNVQNLKTGIRSMQVAHSEYLGKVTRAIEKATAEHRSAIEAVKRDRDVRISALGEEIIRLKKKRCKIQGSSPDKDEIYDLARRLEKLLSPDYLSNVAETAMKQPISTTEFFEGKVSSRARKILYLLEDLATIACNAKVQSDDDCVQVLQQQLVEAYEEIESLQNGADTSVAQKRPLRKIFGRFP